MFVKTCVCCWYEPVWEEGEQEDVKEGLCRRPRLPCDRRFPVKLDTEYMVCEGVDGIIEDCPGFKVKS